MKISFIIPAYNEEKYIADCIDSIIKYGPEEAEIIVIDNASTDQTAQVAGQYPRVKIVAEPDKGLTKARQKGLETAQGELLAYIDADNRISEHWLKILEKEFSKNEELVCLSGRYHFYDGSKIKQALLSPLFHFFVFFVDKLTSYLIYGGNFVAKKQTLLNAGGFDKNIAFYGEDTEIAQRLSKVGKVKFRYDFFVYASARRFHSEGVFKMIFKYSLNYLWIVIFKKPFTKEYKDIR